MRAPEQTYSYRQILGLAGEIYRAISAIEDVQFDIDYYEKMDAIYQARVAILRDKLGWPEDKIEAALTYIKEDGVEWYAVEREANVDSGALGKVTYDEACERLFGMGVDHWLAARSLKLDAPSRLRLLKEVARGSVQHGQRKEQLAKGDFSPDPHLARYPAFDCVQPVDFADLWKQWAAHSEGRREKSTLRRYTPSLKSLAAFLRGKDVRLVTDDDIFAWAEHRRDAENIDAHTVNGNDLVAAASVFSYAMSRDGKRIRKDNPVTGVKLDAPKKRRARDPIFRAAEAEAILKLARSVKIKATYPRASASRRWAPFICAYTGARIQEVCWLTKEDFWCEGGVSVMEFKHTKTGDSRIVPLHEALIDEGLLAFVEKAAPGPLFYGDRPIKQDATHPAAGQRASELASWIRKSVGLEKGVDPNHAWRHSFITRATGKIDKRIQNAICGHNRHKDASDGYYTATVEEMDAALKRFPRYV